MGHWVSQLAQLLFLMCKTASDSKPAYTIVEKVLAVLGLIVTIQHPNVLPAWECLGQWLKKLIVFTTYVIEGAQLTVTVCKVA